MFCPKCGAQNADDAKFCRSCGTDISLVPQAVTGRLAERLANEDANYRGRRRRRRKDKDEDIPSIENAVQNLFSGLGFLCLALALKTWGGMIGASVWWFWLLIPAFAMMGKGVAMYLRVQEDRRKLTPPSYVSTQTSIPPPQRVSALPTRDTGEILPPPSITEGTTRHLSVPVEHKRSDD